MNQKRARTLRKALLADPRTPEGGMVRLDTGQYFNPFKCAYRRLKQQWTTRNQKSGFTPVDLLRKGTGVL